MGRRVPLLLGLLLLLAAPPLFAVQEWYDYYLEARDHLIPSGHYPEAIRDLEQALRLKPSSVLAEQTYGLQFVDYLPHYYLGVCYLKTKDFKHAIEQFRLEESRGAIKRSDTYKDLLRLQAEATNGQAEDMARQARQEAERLLKESADLVRKHSFEDALARLFQAELLAKNLDLDLQRRVTEAREKIRADQKEIAEAASRAHQIEQGLAEGGRLLTEGKGAEAQIAFEGVLRLDSRNTAALDGKRAAQERILASTTREKRAQSFQDGKALFDQGQYEAALGPLTDAAAEPANPEARDLLDRAQKIVAGMRRQKDLKIEIDREFAKGERLLATGKFPEAEVAFEDVLRLDPGNVRAKERMGLAERRTGEALFAKWLPNDPPRLNFFEPAHGREIIEGPSVALVGMANDDRGIGKVEFRVGGLLVAEQTPSPPVDPGDVPRSLTFQRQFPLEPGPNEITVTAIDNTGLSTSEVFHITRRLRFYETAIFLPSAGGAAVGVIGVGWGVQRLRRRRAVRRRFNPYIAGAPVLDEEMFFGRQKLMARMLNVLHHNSLMITGERRIGKTTFLYHLKKTLAEDEGTDYRFFPVFTDLQGVPETAFFHALMADVVEGLGLTPATLAALRHRQEADGYDGRDFSHDLQRVIEELKTRTPRKVKLAFLIDEVDVLNEYSERVNQRLRGIFMKTFSENLVAVMCGVGIKRTWKSEVSPWYNFFDEIELKAFSREEAEALIRTPVAGVFSFRGEAVERILEHSQLRPYLLQKFCVHAINRILEEGRTTVTAQDVEAVREAVQFEGEVEPPPALAIQQPASA
jgi:tetratricopeptide (TPR) repeat protein